MKTRPGICKSKRRYESAGQAEEAAAAAPFTLRVYRCSLCRDYHLTCRTKGMKIPRAELDRADAASPADLGAGQS